MGPDNRDAPVSCKKHHPADGENDLGWLVDASGVGVRAKNFASAAAFRSPLRLRGTPHRLANRVASKAELHSLRPAVTRSACRRLPRREAAHGSQDSQETAGRRSPGGTGIGRRIAAQEIGIANPEAIREIEIKRLPGSRVVRREAGENASADG